MTTLHEFGKGHYFSGKPAKGVFGIEIETETKNAEGYPSGLLPQEFLDHMVNGGPGHLHFGVNGAEPWEVCRDGSLRNYGVEWVTKGVLPYIETIEALNTFRRVTRDVTFLPTPPGCSVHVHLNMQPLTMVQVSNFMALWVMFENILIDYCGDTRRSNLFALPCRAAEKNIDYICDFIARGYASQSGALSFPQNHAKYAAMNLGRLSNLGSLEIRPMRGTTNVDVISKWVTVLWKMYNYAQVINTPHDILSSYRGGDSSIQDFFYSIFGPNLSRDLLATASNDLYTSTMRNFFYIYRIAGELSTEEWEAFKTVLGITAKMSLSTSSPPPQPNTFTIDEFVDIDDVDDDF